jgi:hypothetical protein
MNAQPHTHKLQMDASDSYLWINYGDQTKAISKNSGRRKIRRVAKRMVKRHDRGSSKAGVMKLNHAKVVEEVEQFAKERLTTWGA